MVKNYVSSFSILNKISIIPQLRYKIYRVYFSVLRWCNHEANISMRWIVEVYSTGRFYSAGNFSNLRHISRNSVSLIVIVKC